MELARSPFTLPGKKAFKRVKVCYDTDWITSLHRSENTQKKYDDWKDKKNIDKFMNKIDNKLKSSRYYIHKNNFPYNTENDHYVMWLRDKWYINEDYVVPTVSELFPNKKVTIFENPVEKKSIDAVHLHLFVEKDSFMYCFG